MTDTLELKGRINADGKLEVELPPGLTSVDVKVWIEIEAGKPVTNAEPADEVWTEEEIREALTFKYRDPQEVIAKGLVGTWADSWGDRDPAEWVEEQRKNMNERYKW